MKDCPEDSERLIIRLSPEDQRILVDALINPPKPGPALKRAMEAHRRLIRKSE